MEYYSHEKVGDVSYHQTSSQISSSGKLPFTDLLMSGTVTTCTLDIKENIFLRFPNTVITIVYLWSFLDNYKL